MTVRLRPMSDDEVHDFLALATAERVEDIVKIGAGTYDSAMAATDAATRELFPEGTRGTDNVVFTVVDDDRPVGYLWMRPNPDVPVASWSVWWVFVRDAERRRGIGRQVMLLAEDEVKARGGVEMRLNVFAHNPGARALYDQLGYEPTATQMRKIL